MLNFNPMAHRPNFFPQKHFGCWIFTPKYPIISRESQIWGRNGEIGATLKFVLIISYQEYRSSLKIGTSNTDMKAEHVMSLRTTFS